MRLDPQGNAADMLGANIAGRPSLCEVFEGHIKLGEARIFDVAVGVDLVPAGEESRLSGVKQGLVRVPARERWLTRMLDGEMDEYDT